MSNIRLIQCETLEKACKGCGQWSSTCYNMSPARDIEQLERQLAEAQDCITEAYNNGISIKFVDMANKIINNALTGQKEETMEEYQERVIEERDQLDARLKKLTEFKLTDKFHSLPVPEVKRLNRQVHIMHLYLDVLIERIEAFGPR